MARIKTKTEFRKRLEEAQNKIGRVWINSGSFDGLKAGLNASDRGKLEKMFDDLAKMISKLK